MARIETDGMRAIALRVAKKHKIEIGNIQFGAYGELQCRYKLDGLNRADILINSDRIDNAAHLKRIVADVLDRLYDQLPLNVKASAMDFGDCPVLA